ncbi:hypothetical protein AYO40_02030 [Planctomycetaceae bacterium SCGC AG-212-D15]|nr:hypothetical protein AYO40_02030 [Planctomycetaceae bacterium SCGC AG-212-D15]
MVSDAPSDFLPTVFSSYRPLEDYVEALDRAGVEPDRSVIAPVDAFGFSVLARLLPQRPRLIDQAGAATRGMSSLLCYAQAGCTTQVHDQDQNPGRDWEAVFERFVAERPELAGHRTVAFHDDEALDQVKRQGVHTTVVFAATEANRHIVAPSIARWAVAGPHVTVAIFGLGNAGSCPLLASMLARYTCGAAQRFALIRELGPAYHGCGLGLIYTPGRFGVESSLARMKCLGSGNFDYLTLVKNACTAAIASTRADEASLWARPNLLAAAGVVPTGSSGLRVAFFGLRQTCKGVSYRVMNRVKCFIPSWSVPGSRSG